MENLRLEVHCERCGASFAVFVERRFCTSCILEMDKEQRNKESGS